MSDQYHLRKYLQDLNEAADTHLKQKFINGKISLEAYLEKEVELSTKLENDIERPIQDAHRR